MDGKGVEEITSKVWEFIFICVTNWSLEYIRRLPEPEFKTLAPMVLAKFQRDCFKPIL